MRCKIQKTRNFIEKETKYNCHKVIMNDTLKRRDVLGVFLKHFIKSCGMDDLKLTPLVDKFVGPVGPVGSVGPTAPVQPTQLIISEPSSVVTKTSQPAVPVVPVGPVASAPVEIKPSVVPLFETRVVFSGNLSSGLGICKVKDMWSTIPSVFRQDVSQVSEKRASEEIEFIVQFKNPLPGSQLPDLFKWAESIEKTHLIKAHVATRTC